MKAHNEKNADLQILRGIAIIMVVLQHYKWRLPSADWYSDSVNYLSYWSGVDIFLALSGFLMFGVISREFSKNGKTIESFRSFFIKRIFRLYPALAFWVLMSIAVAWYVSPFFNADGNLAAISAIPSLFAYSNFYWYECVVTASNCGSSDLSGITWSLSLEWQLYVALFLLMLVTNKRYLVLILFLSIIASFFVPSDPSQAKSLAWWTRPQSFVIGVIIAMVNSRFEIKLSRTFRLLLLILSVVAICTLPKHVDHRMLTFTVGVLGGLCLLSCVQGDLFGGGIIGKAFLWIGDRSYSLYLSHLIVIHAFAKLIRDNEALHFINDNGYIALLICVSLLAAISHLSYAFIEIPLIKVGKKLLSK